jgi:hypothetical protein
MPISLTSPEAAIAATPYLVGFTPVDSCVLLLCDGRDLRMSVRVDLPPYADVDWLIGLLDGLGDPVPESAVLLVYADTVPLEFAQGIAHWVTCTMSPLLEVLDSVVVHEGRAHSRAADPYDEGHVLLLTDLANHPVVAECVAAGMTHLARREDLRDQLDPVPDEVSAQVADLLRDTPSEPYEVWRDRTEVAVSAALVSSEPLSAPDVADIGRACRDVYVRDPLLALLLDEGAEHDLLHHVRGRLIYAAVHLPDRYAGGVAATIALLSWAAGEWAAAEAAAQRAEEADPTNTLGPLVLDALTHRLPPDTWATLTRDIPMEVLRGRGRRSA